jgi:hypothetical protein
VSKGKQREKEVGGWVAKWRAKDKKDGFPKMEHGKKTPSAHLDRWGFVW